MEKDGWSGLERGEPACGSCGAAIASCAGGSYAALFPEGEGFRRRDFCTPCFEKLPARPFSFWKRSARPKEGASAEEGKDEKRERRRRDLDALVELFERLSRAGAERTADHEKLRYLLALALVRKKRLHLVDLARSGGADCLLIRTSGEAEVVEVPAPALSKEDLSRLARDLEQEVGLS